MKFFKIMTCLGAMVLLFGLTGCSGAPGANDSAVKDLVIKNFRKLLGGHRSPMELRSIRTISVDRETKKTRAQAELLVYTKYRPSPTINHIVYTAQYNSNGDLLVTIVSSR